MGDDQYLSILHSQLHFASPFRHAVPIIHGANARVRQAIRIARAGEHAREGKRRECGQPDTAQSAGLHSGECVVRLMCGGAAAFLLVVALRCV